MGLRGTWWDKVGFGGTKGDFLGQVETLWDKVGFGGTKGNLVGLRRTWWDHGEPGDTM